MKKLNYLTAAFLATGLWVETSSAREFIPLFGLEVEQHSNARRTSTNEIEDTAIKPYVGLEFTDNTATTNASIKARAAHERWTDETYDGQTFYTIDGFVDWIISPGRFVWAVEDYAYSQRIDPLELPTSNNLQNFNVFQTGPDFMFTRGPLEGVAKIRLGNVFYSETDTDNNRVNVSGSLRRFLNDYSDLSLEAALSKIMYRENFLNDYDVSSVVGKYRRDLPYGRLLLGAGLGQISYENGGSEDSPIALASIALGNKEDPNQLRLALSQNISDPALDANDPLFSRLYLFEGERLINPSEVTGVGAYELTKGELVYTFAGTRFNSSISGYVNRKEYPDVPDINTDEKGGSVSVGYSLGERLGIWASFGKSSTDYLNGTNAGIFVNSTSPQGGITYLFNDRLTLSVGTSRIKNDSNELRLDYDDDVVFFRVDYRGLKKETDQLVQEGRN
ncbi:MAG: hypothetical protein ACFCUJ_01720 [Thiotrichales bacterium]